MDQLADTDMEGDWLPFQRGLIQPIKK